MMMMMMMIMIRHCVIYAYYYYRSLARSNVNKGRLSCHRFAVLQ